MMRQREAKQFRYFEEIDIRTLILQFSKEMNLLCRCPPAGPYLNWHRKLNESILNEGVSGGGKRGGKGTNKTRRRHSSRKNEKTTNKPEKIPMANIDLSRVELWSVRRASEGY